MSPGVPPRTGRGTAGSEVPGWPWASVWIICVILHYCQLLTLLPPPGSCLPNPRLVASSELLPCSTTMTVTDTCLVLQLTQSPHQPSGSLAGSWGNILNPMLQMRNLRLAEWKGTHLWSQGKSVSDRIPLLVSPILNPDVHHIPPKVDSQPTFVWSGT